MLVRPGWTDGLPGPVGMGRGTVLQTTALAIEGGRIVDVHITRDPDKPGAVAKRMANSCPLAP